MNRPAAILKLYWSSVIVIEEGSIFLDPVYLERKA